MPFDRFPVSQWNTRPPVWRLLFLLIPLKNIGKDRGLLGIYTPCETYYLSQLDERIDEMSQQLDLYKGQTFSLWSVILIV